MTDTHTQAFIARHRHDDVRRLALSAASDTAVDLPFALEQIQGWQTARTKLPTWAQVDGIVFPPHISMEQCSSEATATYKQQLVASLVEGDLRLATFADLTGGFGVDFSFMSCGFGRAIYVERNERLCDVARHNFALLDMTHAEVVCADGAAWLHGCPDVAETDAPVVVYLDPARRDTHGQKVFGLHDCTPDVTHMAAELLSKAHTVIIKLSPMLDWHAAVDALTTDGRGAEVHIVCVTNECKELVVVLTRRSTPLKVVCVNDDQTFVYLPNDPMHSAGALVLPPVATDIAGTLLVPNAAIMKAGCFDALATRFAISPLGANSHLFVSPCDMPDFPGRRFQILGLTTMNKKSLKAVLGSIEQANIAVRNFPLSVAALRKRLKLRDGGSHYLFATTWQDKHVIIVTCK